MGTSASLTIKKLYFAEVCDIAKSVEAADNIATAISNHGEIASSGHNMTKQQRTKSFIQPGKPVVQNQ